MSAAVWEGLVNVLKPPGMTSSDVVADIRKIFSMRRVGHTGTLDPGAAGVLGVCLGRATRLFDLLVDKEKEYIAELSFGASTDTQDSYGRVLARSQKRPSRSEVEAVLPAFVGLIEQQAPLFSALKVDGKAMYAHAREGHAPQRKTRRVEVKTVELIERSAQERYLLRIVCGKGTYIRTICHDIGQRLGVPAHMSALLRTRAGALRVEDAFTIPELGAMRDAGTLGRAVIAPDTALGFLPAFSPQPGTRERQLLFNGSEIAAPQAPQGVFRLYVDESFVGVGESRHGKIHLGISFLPL